MAFVNTTNYANTVTHIFPPNSVVKFHLTVSRQTVHPISVTTVAPISKAQYNPGFN